MTNASVAYKVVQFPNKMGNDVGSEAKLDLQTWRPDVPDGWFYLGHSATNFYNKPPFGVIVKALEPDVFQDVKSWELVWDDRSSGNKDNYALWRGIPPNSDYVVIGGILSNNRNYDPPTASQTAGIKAIRKNLVVMDHARMVWNDKKTGAKLEGSVWETEGKEGIATGAMLNHDKYDQIPMDHSYSLNIAKIMKM